MNIEHRTSNVQHRIKRQTIQVASLLLVFLLFLLPAQGFALQVHAEPEGLYSHQLGHMFFVFSMAVFAFWLQKTQLAEKRGWRYIQVSCVIFILWNLGAIAGHMLESRLSEDAFVRISSGRALVMEKAAAPYLYYFLKLDHLIAVPAMIFLLLGLNRLKKESGEGRS
jgi:hypothetical protein